MPVIKNKNTSQDPITLGSTGTQSIVWIPAPRVYIKAKDTTATPILVKSNGTTPSGYTDLGIVKENVGVTYEKQIKEIRTGIDQILRVSYVEQRNASFEFPLSQFDDKVIQELSGLTPSQIVNASIYQFAIGTEEIVEKAIILVSQNKLDGKEWQFYHPKAEVSFTYEQNGDEQVVRGRCNLPSFTHGGEEKLMVQTIFA